MSSFVQRTLTPAANLRSRRRNRVWIAKLGAEASPFPMWDLAPDGKRAAVLTPVETAEAPKQDHEIVMLQNIFDERRRKVPVRK